MDIRYRVGQRQKLRIIARITRRVYSRILSSYVSVNIDRTSSANSAIVPFVSLNRGNLGMFPVEIDRNLLVVVGSVGRIEKCKNLPGSFARIDAHVG